MVNEQLPVLISAAGVLFLGLLFFLLYHYYEKKRSEEMKEFALQQGYTFTMEPEIDDGLKRFKLGRKGHSHKLMNLISRSKRGEKVMVFDYQFIIGYGKNQRFCRQTVIRLTAPNIPVFILTRERFINKMAEKLGFQDIDFEEDKTFSETFVLKGENEAAIRKQFTSAVRQEALADNTITIECNGDELLFYRPSKYVKVNELLPVMMRAQRFKTALPQSN
jgi:hypothetical protein